MHLPRLRAGEALYDRAAAHAGRSQSLRAGKAALRGPDLRTGGCVDGLVCRVVRFLRRISQGGDRRRRRARRPYPREAGQGQKLPHLPRAPEHAVYLRRPGLVARLGALPATNNAAESASAQLRHLLREHRGLSLERRIKAVYWWCYMHTECPLPAARILKVMPTDQSIGREMNLTSYESGARVGPQEWGDGLVWEELHRQTPWRRDWD